MSFRFFHVLVCAAIFALLNYAGLSAAQQVCNGKAEPLCNPNSRYRTLTGACNNLQRPLLGAAETAFRRLLRPDYADLKSKPRKSRRSIEGFTRLFPLPNARNISLALFKDVRARSQKLTHMFMLFGEFLAHDVAFTAQPEGFTCDGSCQHVNECFGIPANRTGDPAFPGADGVNCIILRRNKPCTEDVPREQVNLVSTYIDASHIYGANEEEANAVRDLTTNAGLLRSMPQEITSTEDLLPPANPHIPCRSSDSKNRPCFLTGDPQRNNENSALNAMHTIWVREHNRIALKLGQINPFWSGEEIYEETRRIIIAILQHITYNEFLPSIVGEENLKSFDLKLLTSGRFLGYDPTIDPTIPNSMAAAAMRYGHSLIRNEFARLKKNLVDRFPAIPVREFLNPEFVYEIENGGVDSIMRGLAKDEANEVDRFFATAILQFHLGAGGQNGPSRGDLLSINIQRGRDHGLPGYNQFRINRTDLSPLNFDSLSDVIPSKVLLSLRKAYDGRIEDVDLFVGGILEKPNTMGSIVGPTFASILGETFKNLRRGDRFWYEIPENEQGSFTTPQLQELRKASLARLICDNSDTIHQIQPNVLRQKGDADNVNTPCEDLASVSLQAWKVKKGPILH